MGKIKIYAILLLVMAFWGGTLVSVKVLVEHYHPFTLTAIRILIAGVSLFILLFALKKIRKPLKEEWKWIILASFLGVIAHHLLLSTGLMYTTGVKASIISGFSPILTAILALFFGLNDLKVIRLLGFLLGTIGIILAVTAGGNLDLKPTIGDVLIFLSFLSQAFCFILIRKVSKTMESVVLTCYMLLFGSVILVIVATINSPRSWVDMMNVPFGYMILVILTAILSITFGHTIYNYAIAKIGAAETAIISNFNLIFALIFSSIFLNEFISFMQIMGMLLVVLGVLLGTGAFEAIIQKLKWKKINLYKWGKL